MQPGATRLAAGRFPSEGSVHLLHRALVPVRVQLASCAVIEPRTTAAAQHRSRAWRSAVVAAASATVALAGCGGSSSGSDIASQPAAAILAASRRAVQDGSSVHVHAVLGEVGALSGSTQADFSARAGRGRFVLGGLGFELLVIGPTAYLRGSPAFNRQYFGAGAARIGAGAWVRGSALSGRLASLSQAVDRRRLFSRLLSTTARLTKGSESTIAGRKVIEVKEGGRKLSASRIFIAASGKPYPVEIIKLGAESSKIDFSGWGEALALSPPQSTIDIASLPVR